MLKKIRCFYWSKRDRGKGRQVIILAVVIAFCLVAFVGVTVGSLIKSRQKLLQVHMETGASTGAVTGTSADATTGTSVSTESALSGETEPEEQVQVAEPTQTPVELVVDTSGLDAFHGFMTEESYVIMEEQIQAECEKRQCKSAKKLNYQQISQGSFDVASFILLSDGSILRCDYNLKSSAVSICQTEYSEADITAMHNEEVKAEQQVLERQQAADKKAKQTEKKSKSKSKKKTETKEKKNKGKTKKKSSGGKSATKKKGKSKGSKK